MSTDTKSDQANLGDEKVRSDRELLKQAQAEGKVFAAYVRLSGPGWLQSAITLGGGSLAGALFLGVLGGTSMIWLQLIAILCGVVMLSAISYVTLSTQRRPFEAINTEINPALGWGWLIATCIANLVACMPQYGLCYDALDRNLFTLGGGAGLGNATGTKLSVSLIILVAAGFLVLLNTRRGRAAKCFDIFLKALIAIVVICFFGVVATLAVSGKLNFTQIFTGLIPKLNQWTQPAGELGPLVTGLPETWQSYWSTQIVAAQRSVMIAAAATAVGINMTFLLPYSMLSRGWDKPFRGLARFDLTTGMAIPYLLVTSCVVIAAASSFHATIDDELQSSDLVVMQSSPIYGSVEEILLARIDAQLGDEAEGTDRNEKLAMASQLSVAEKTLALSLVKRDAFQLSQTLSPLLGESLAKLVFGLGVFGMGFSTIMILMLINGFAFREMTNRPDGTTPFVLGCLVAGSFGALWVFLWDGEAKFWLAIFAHSFNMMLLPIAYVTFFLMMNSRRILGSEKPTGMRMVVWNGLMSVAVVLSIAAAATAIYDKAMDKSHPLAYYVVMSILTIYGSIVLIGFALRLMKSSRNASQ